MQFALRKLGSTKLDEITKAEYEEIRTAKNSYSRIIRVEENFDAVMEDYVELEETLLHFGIRHLAFHSSNHLEFQNMRNVINRRLLHVLSTARLYRDALLKNSKALLKNDGSFQQIKEELEDSPRQPMEFRIIEALRNYSQHHDFPISGMTKASRWESDGNSKAKERAAYFVSAKMDASAIARERTLASDLKEALLELGSDADIIVTIRRYIQHLGSIHSMFRELIKSKEKQWLKTMRDAIARGEGQPLQHEGLPDLVYVIGTNDDGTVHEIQLFEDFFSVLSSLRIKNGSQVNLSKRYVRWSAHQ